MDPTLHYVAFGALHKSKADLVVRDRPPRPPPTASREASWIPVPFSNDYKANRDAAINTSSKLVRGVQCLPSGAVANLSTGSYGTHLASAMKGAARYLLGKAPNNLAVAAEAPGHAQEGHHLRDRRAARRARQRRLDLARHQRGPGRRPQLLRQRQRREGLRQLRQGGHRGEGLRRHRARHRLRRRQHRAVREAGDLGRLRAVRRGRRGCATTWPGRRRPGRRVRPARPRATARRTPSAIAENEDGDYYFCAAPVSELGPIFATAIIAVTESIRLIQMP